MNSVGEVVPVGVVVAAAVVVVVADTLPTTSQMPSDVKGSKNKVLPMQLQICRCRL